MPTSNTNPRKSYPIYSGVISYFPDAIKEVAKVSKIGSDQHNPGGLMFWDRPKSPDHLDALTRHLTDHANGNIFDADNQLHLAKVAWRALAELQLEIERLDKKSG